MPSLSVRSAISSDIPSLMLFDHGYSTDHVWQMAYSGGAEGAEIRFQEVRLPRPMRVAYPRQVENLADEWSKRLAVLVGEQDEATAAYLAMVEGPAPGSVWVTDLVVDLRSRRQGFGAAMVRSAAVWARERGFQAMFLEMQSKNFPAISMSRKLGFNFAGYSDRYYPDQDIALFFALSFQ